MLYASIIRFRIGTYSRHCIKKRQKILRRKEHKERKQKMNLLHRVHRLEFNYIKLPSLKLIKSNSLSVGTKSFLTKAKLIINFH